LARNPNPVFNVVLIGGHDTRDLDLSVNLRPVAGVNDQGGGLIWRAKDAKNYYVARFNPLENNFRVYTVVDGKRTQLQSAEATYPGAWCHLRVTMKGDHIVCYKDGVKLLDVHDATFPGPGKIGLWSKSDAQTEFDELKLQGL
ncbi:MAG: family 16 glycoside hydrolase, partial [Isosphaeraceae bacterium]